LIADVRSEIDQRHDIAIEAVGTVIAQHGDKLVDHSEELIKTVQRDLFALFERRFGELMGRLDVVLPEPRSRESKSFRFASERVDDDKDKAIDLPDWRKMH
jgi:hypothetical protein